MYSENVKHPSDHVGFIVHVPRLFVRSDNLQKRQGRRDYAFQKMGRSEIADVHWVENAQVRKDGLSFGSLVDKYVEYLEVCNIRYLRKFADSGCICVE